VPVPCLVVMVEDDVRLARSLARRLTAEGFDVRRPGSRGLPSAMSRCQPPSAAQRSSPAAPDLPLGATAFGTARRQATRYGWFRGHGCWVRSDRGGTPWGRCPLMRRSAGYPNNVAREARDEGLGARGPREPPLLAASGTGPAKRWRRGLAAPGARPLGRDRHYQERPGDPTVIIKTGIDPARQPPRRSRGRSCRCRLVRS